MITEKGKLRYGIKFGDLIHTEFELRPVLVKDSIRAEQVTKNKGDVAMNVAVMAEQLLSLGAIPKEQITADLLGEMYDADIAILQAAREAVEKKLEGQSRG